VKIGGVYTLALPPDRAYQVLQDPEVLAKCIPGCEGLELVGDNEYKMKMKMALASVSGAFEGRVRLRDQTPPDSFRLEVDGTGKIGFVKGSGLLKLAPKDGDTAVHIEVTYDGDVQVGGTIAAVGQRLIDSTAKMMIKRFFDKLAETAC
jgi:carbon monoxide dehydrogenase subunit G